MVAYTNPKRADGTVYGVDTTDAIAFYGKTPVTQRASATQAAITAGATTTVCNTAVAEIQNFLTTIGLWKGGA